MCIDLISINPRPHPHISKSRKESPIVSKSPGVTQPMESALFSKWNGDVGVHEEIDHKGEQLLQLAVKVGQRSRGKTKGQDVCAVYCIRVPSCRTGSLVSQTNDVETELIDGWQKLHSHCPFVGPSIPPLQYVPHLSP